MFCRRDYRKPVMIFKGDDTDFDNSRKIFFEVETNEEISIESIEFSFLGVKKNFNDNLTNSRIEVSFSKEETDKFPYGLSYATIVATDDEGRRRTLDNRIPIIVTNSVEAAYGSDDDKVVSIPLEVLLAEIVAPDENAEQGQAADAKKTYEALEKKCDKPTTSTITLGANAETGDADGTGIGTIAIGENAKAQTTGSIAIGQNSEATGPFPFASALVAIGAEAKATPNEPIVIGSDSTAITAKAKIVVTKDGVMTIGGKEVAMKNGSGGGISQMMIEVEHAELKSLRDNGELIPGMQYRITDYVATTTQSGTRSANHPFDIIVTADDEHTLSESASAIRHEGDTYFPATTRFDAWKVQYILDNDNSYYPWSDKTNGKGVIYRLTDEFCNSLSFDFKGITDDEGVYSINKGLPLLPGFPEIEETKDGSLEGYSWYITDVGGPGMLYFNYFYSCQLVRLLAGCHSNKIYGSYYVTLMDACTDNTIGLAYSVTLGEHCSNNSILNQAERSVNAVTLGAFCDNNNIGSDYTTIGRGCSDIFINFDSVNISIGDGCQVISIGYHSGNITIGNGCSHISFGTSSESTYGYTRNVTVDDGVSVVTFSGLPSGESIQNVEIKSGVYSKTIEISYENKIYRDALTTIKPIGSYNMSV